MGGKVFIKRVLPFFLTFAVGLFIASFFVTIAAPNFNFNRGFRKHKHQQYHRAMESDNYRLREENLRLKKQLTERELQNLHERNLDFAVPPPPPPPPAPAKVQTIPYNGR